MIHLPLPSVTSAASEAALHSAEFGQVARALASVIAPDELLAKAAAYGRFHH